MMNFTFTAHFYTILNWMVLLEPVFHYVMFTFVPFCSYFSLKGTLLPSVDGVQKCTFHELHFPAYMRGNSVRSGLDLQPWGWVYRPLSALD